MPAFVRVGGAESASGQPVFSNDNNFHCTIDNGIQFATGMTPGWANGEKYDDPRNPKDGPLPHESAHYKGVYLHGKQMVLSYSVGKTDVLELPGVTFVAFFENTAANFTAGLSRRAPRSAAGTSRFSWPTKPT